MNIVNVLFLQNFFSMYCSSTMNSVGKTEEMDVDDSDSVTICRLCAEMTSSKSFIPLYTEDKQEQPVVKQINELVSNLVSCPVSHVGFIGRIR